MSTTTARTCSIRMRCRRTTSSICSTTNTSKQLMVGDPDSVAAWDRSPPARRSGAGRCPTWGVTHQHSVDPIDVEGRRVEVVARPLAPLIVLAMVWISQRNEEVRVRVGATDVLRRTGSLTVQASRQRFSNRFDRQLVLHLDQVLPAIPEIVLIHARRSSSRSDLVELDRGVVDRRWLELVVFLAEAHIANFELVKVGIRPSHHHLQDPMEARQPYVLRHQKPPPDRRFDVEQTDLQLEDVVRPAESSARGTTGAVVAVGAHRCTS